MLPAFLLPETEVRESGFGQVFDLGASGTEDSLESLLITLGVTHTVEQESLDVFIQGSADGVNWTAKPILSFPQKFYCGTYQMLLDLSAHRDVRYLRSKWTLNRWGRGELKPLFGMYLFAQRQAKRVMATSA